jgi:hypothetical protein
MNTKKNCKKVIKLNNVIKMFSVIMFLKIIIVSEIQSQIVVNEIMYAPSEANNEWFEIFNTGSTAVNIQNWKWKDATATLRILTVNNTVISPGGFAVICQDSVKLKSMIPDLQGMILQTVWSQLNNSGDNVILIKQDNSRSDSVNFNSSWGGSSGAFSLEKKIADGNSNESANWSTSVALSHSTPGKINSVTPKQNDLFLKSFTYSPLYPAAGENIDMNFVIKNSGINQAENFSLKIFNDLNSDSTGQNNELIKTLQYSFMASGDSISVKYTLSVADTGQKQFIALIFYPADNDTLNNLLIKRIYFSSQGSGGGGIVFNEIMYDPFTEQSEWIEIFNSTSQSINIKGWKYKESTSTVILSAQDLIFNPGDYLILAQDSSVYNVFPYLRTAPANIHIKFSGGISLSNTGETLTLTDSLNNIIDAVSYNPLWNNPGFTDTKGISLEKINPSLISNDGKNWSSCVKPAGGTPGLLNSIYTEKKFSESKVSVTPNPFSPDGDGFEDFALLKYELKAPFALMRVRIFDIKGRLVKTLLNNAVTGNQGEIIYNGFDENNQKLRTGIYILLMEAIDDTGGTVETVKSPLVIAARL